MARALPFKFFWNFLKFLFFAKVKWKFRNHLVSLQENAFSKKCSAWCNGRWIKKGRNLHSHYDMRQDTQCSRGLCFLVVEDIVIIYFLLFSFTRFFRHSWDSKHFSSDFYWSYAMNIPSNIALWNQNTWGCNQWIHASQSTFRQFERSVTVISLFIIIVSRLGI